MNLKVPLLLLLILPLVAMAQEVRLESSNLPIFVITTSNAIDIPDEPKVIAHMGIIYNGISERNNLTDKYNEYDGQIAIELRGNGSLLRDKKSYLLETQKSDGENNNVSLLGMPSENDWILYAPETDKSLMRNVLSYELANNMGYYATRTAYCELIINDEYLGIFVLMEKIKRDKNRVNITSFNQDNAALPSKGGFIIKIDSWWNEQLGWKSNPYLSDSKETEILYQYVYPKHDDITPIQSNYIEEYITTFENRMDQSSIDSLHLTYETYIDVNNFADYIIINELSKNPDAYRLSTFIHKDADVIDPKLKLGPIWDYNFGFGNYCCGYHTDPSGWIFDNSFWDHPGQIPFWFPKLMESPSFNQLIIQRWKEWRKELISCENFSTQISKWANTLDEAKDRNFTRWPILGTNVLWDWNAGDRYEDETDLLQKWICNRIDWMDDHIPKLGITVLDSKTSVYPNPNNGRFTLQYISDDNSTKAVVVYNIMGGIISRQQEEFTTGVNEFTLNLETLDAGIYMVQVEREQAVKVVVY